MSVFICIQLLNDQLCDCEQKLLIQTPMPPIVLSNGNNKNSKGYRVSIAGIRMDRFNANPVMLYMHDLERVIGRWENIRKEDNKLIADPVFDSNDPEAKEIERKVKENFLRAASLGLIPLKVEEIDGDIVMTESELAEASIVPIPSDSGAVRLYNENMEELTFEEVKINFNFNNNQKSIQMGDVAFKLSQKTVESLSLDADHTPKDVELAVAEKDKAIERLTAEVNTLKKTQQDEFLTNAVKAGKITEAEKLTFVKLCEKGCFDDVKSIIEAKPEVASETLADKVQKSTLSVGRESWDYLKWMKEDPKGLGNLKLENPKEFERLQLTIKK